MEATSQASSLSATSKEVVNLEEKDFSSKHDEASNSNNSHNNIEFVNLCKDFSVRKLKVRELDLLSSMMGDSTSDHGGEENNTKEEASKRTYLCNFCKREFSTSRALGGHQKAHKLEHKLKKQLNQRLDNGALEQHNIPNNTYPSLITTPPYNRQLGVRMESMIQKPSYPSTPYSFGYGHHAMWWQHMIHPSNVRLGNIGGICGATSRIEVGGGSDTKNNNGSLLRFGDACTNIATSSSTITDKQIPSPNKDEIHHSNIREISSDSDSSGLDLSLKL